MNSFGPSTSQQYPLCDAREPLHNRERFRREFLPNLARANHFYLSTGRWPFRGWILLDRNSYNQLSLYGTTFQLSIGDPTNPDNIGILKNLSIVQAKCVTRGMAADSNALYLVELTDGRGVVWNDWFSFPLTAAYNVRAPAYPQTFYPWSMNSGTTWTWSTMLQDIWSTMPTFLGTWPGLPSTPSGTPEGFEFQGVAAWTALNDVLDYLGLAVACDYTQSNPFTIVTAGATDATFDTLTTRYEVNLEDDLEWIDQGAARVPGTMKVFFRRRNSVYGTEETVRYDSPHAWQYAPAYSVTLSSPATFSSAPGTGYLWSDFTVRYDMDGSPLAEDVAVAASIAQDRVNAYFGKVYRQTAGFMTRTYAGALPFKTGSQVDGVCYYMGRDDSWHTQLVRGPRPPFPILEE